MLSKLFKSKSSAAKKARAPSSINILLAYDTRVNSTRDTTSPEDFLDALQSDINCYITFVEKELKRRSPVSIAFAIHRHGKYGLMRAKALAFDANCLVHEYLIKRMSADDTLLALRELVKETRLSGRNHPNSLNSYIARHDPSLYHQEDAIESLCSKLKCR